MRGLPSDGFTEYRRVLFICSAQETCHLLLGSCSEALNA